MTTKYNLYKALRSKPENKIIMHITQSMIIPNSMDDILLGDYEVVSVSNVCVSAENNNDQVFVGIRRLGAPKHTTIAAGVAFFNPKDLLDYNIGFRVAWSRAVKNLLRQEYGGDYMPHIYKRARRVFTHALIKELFGEENENSIRK